MPQRVDFLAERSHTHVVIVDLFAQHAQIVGHGVDDELLIGQRLAAPAAAARGGQERRRLLDAWKFELELSGETQKAPSQAKEFLRRVNACRRLLSEEED